MLTIKAEIKNGEQKVDGMYNVKLRLYPHIPIDKIPLFVR